MSKGAGADRAAAWLADIAGHVSLDWVAEARALDHGTEYA